MGVEEDILRSSRTVAVVGLSTDWARPSNIVARYLQFYGYQIIPINPNEKEILGEKCYPNLSVVPVPVDVVDVFRRSEDVIPVAEEAIKIKAKALWLQVGIINEAAAAMAISAGLQVVMDKCMRKELMNVQGGVGK
jgi:predicted CoA-binding protein